MSNANGHNSSGTPGAGAPMGYGHDDKGAAIGAAKNDGRRTHASKRGQRTKDRRLHPRRRRGRCPRGRDDLAGGERQGADIPHLCYLPKPGYRPDGNCRVCMVEVEGERVLAASCIRTPTPGMKVKTQTERAKSARRMVVELLLTDQPPRTWRTIRSRNSGRPPTASISR